MRTMLPAFLRFWKARRRVLREENAVADGSFRGDLVVAAMEKERLALIGELRNLRREATIDAAVGLVGCPAALFHAFADWSLIFRILGVAWLPYAVSGVMLLWGAFNLFEVARLAREEESLT